MGKYVIHQIGVIKEGVNGKKSSFKYVQFIKPTRYAGEKLRQLRAERGVGNVRKIKKEVANG